MRERISVRRSTALSTCEGKISVGDLPAGIISCFARFVRLKRSCKSSWTSSLSILDDLVEVIGVAPGSSWTDLLRLSSESESEFNSNGVPFSGSSLSKSLVNLSLL